MDRLKEEVEDMEVVLVEEEDEEDKSANLPSVVFDWSHKGTAPKRILPVPPPPPRNLVWVDPNDGGDDGQIQKRLRLETDLDKPDILCDLDVYRKSAKAVEEDGEETSSGANSNILDYSHGAEHHMQNRKYLLNPLFKIKKKTPTSAPVTVTEGMVKVVNEVIANEDRIVREIALELAAMEGNDD